MIKFYNVLSCNKMNDIHHFLQLLTQRVKLFHAKLKEKKNLVRVMMPRHDRVVNHFIGRPFPIQTKVLTAAHDYFYASLTGRMS